MRFWGMVTMTAAMAGGAWAGVSRPAPAGAVRVCMGPGADASIVFRAEAIATRILANAGVRLAWQGSCAQAIRIAISTSTAPADHPGALAYAMPFEGTRIVVFYDRIRHEEPTLLGHVIAHEITHLLQGVIRHSATGLMKKDWDKNDLSAMRGEPLGFTEADIRMIRAGLDHQAARASQPKQ